MEEMTNTNIAGDVDDVAETPEASDTDTAYHGDPGDENLIKGGLLRGLIPSERHLREKLADMEVQIRTLTEEKEELKRNFDEAVESNDMLGEMLIETQEANSIISMHYNEPRCVVCKRVPDFGAIQSGAAPRWQRVDGKSYLENGNADAMLVFCPDDWAILSGVGDEPAQDSELYPEWLGRREAAQRIVELTFAVAYERCIKPETIAPSLGVTLVETDDESGGIEIAPTAQAVLQRLDTPSPDLVEGEVVVDEVEDDVA